MVEADLSSMESESDLQVVMARSLQPWIFQLPRCVLRYIRRGWALLFFCLCSDFGPSSTYGWAQMGRGWGDTGGGGAGDPPRHQTSELISAKYFQFEIRTVLSNLTPPPSPPTHPPALPSPPVPSPYQHHPYPNPNRPYLWHVRAKPGLINLVGCTVACYEFYYFSRLIIQV